MSPRSDHHFSGMSSGELKPAKHIRRRAILRAAVALPGVLLASRAMAAPPDGQPFAARVVQSGHSLTDPVVPMLDAMVAAVGGQAGRGRVIDASTIPGSPMDWRWNNSPDYGPDARHDISHYDVLVITERAPLSNTMPWHDSAEVALRWVKHAWREGNEGQGAQSFLYATWVHINSGPDFDNPDNDPDGHLPFRIRLDREMTNWQAIADHVNANRPGMAPPMRIIPGPAIMAAAYDAVAKGQAPGLSDFADLFSDQIHLSDAGTYLIALAHFAMIYGRDPREIPERLGRRSVPAPRTAAWMKGLVHEVLQDYRPKTE
ncbi:MAG: hypothetical protein WEB56_03880 [Roseovarius sp.]